MTRYGLISVVFKKNEGVVMRARNITHLKALYTRVKKEQIFTKWVIKSTPNNDYCCRVCLSRKEWKAVSEILTNEIDWPNFKDECKRAKVTDDAYLNLLHDVWVLGMRYQTRLTGPVSTSDQFGDWDKLKRK